GAGSRGRRARDEHRMARPRRRHDHGGARAAGCAGGGAACDRRVDAIARQTRCQASHADTAFAPGQRGPPVTPRAATTAYRAADGAADPRGLARACPVADSPSRSRLFCGGGLLSFQQERSVRQLRMELIQVFKRLLAILTIAALAFAPMSAISL